MALTRSTVDEHYSSETTSNYTTPSFNADEGDLLVVAVGWVRATYGSSYSEPEWTVTSTGMSFNRPIGVAGTTTSWIPTLEVYYAIVPSTGSRTITIGAGSKNHLNWTAIYKYSGVDQDTPVRQSRELTVPISTVNNGAYTWNLDSATLSTSQVIAFAHVDSLTECLMTPNTSAGWVEVMDDGTFTNFQVMYRDSSTSTEVSFTDVNVNNVTLYDQWLFGAFEIKAAGVALIKSICATIATSGGSQTSITTPSFTPNNNSLLVAAINCQEDHDPYSTFNESVSGGGLIWTKRVENEGSSSAGGFGCKQYIYTAPVSTGASMTVNFQPVTDTVGGAAITIYEFQNYNTSTPTGATQANNGYNRSGAWTGNLSGTPNSSSYIVSIACSDEGTITPNTSWTSSDFSTDPYCTSSGNWYIRQDTTSTTGKTSTTISWTAVTTSYTWATSSLEIVAAEEAAASRRVFIMC